MPEDELLEALRGLGADHEPDVAAIRRRMEGERPNVVPLRRRVVEQGPRRRPVFLSAAAAILIGGGVTVAASQMGPSDTGTPATKLPVEMPELTTPSHTPTSAAPTTTESDSDDRKESTPDKEATSKGGQPDGEDKTSDDKDSTPPTSTTQSKQPPASSGSGTGAAAAIGTVTPLSTGQEIVLGDADEDWLAIGSRNDMKTVRKKSSSTSPLLNFVAPDSASSVDGPFKLSWEGGVPESNRAGSTRWMQTNGAVVTVTASQAARTVTLYTGNAMNIVVKGGGLKDLNVTLGDNAQGFVTTLQIPSHAGDTTIELQSGRGPVHLAAATAASR
ncbi:hypothetical protein Kisp01_06210 [Kineosporia sp. NBRC 101677]|uniref:hypothetical protein n=1 Tax=Kineosporia sp. NBRC 101677 TaxID=3032197 RepID=UPI0024A5FDE5|nr:hypothetical protein [Kineosporia sp. NBRC 101677]GLY13605.1 hypothetical protein Kisp01_06210 [Kineosporia sp. NBRC 101677]